ncbi:MAG: hypothetical protein JWO89_2534 [Verrucomicrobiaceae bacterium]|nr:hypothetical protein [Verrucomicrobiaceae bacterium]
MLLPAQIRLIAAILALLVLGWWVKRYRDHAEVETIRVRVKR